MFVFIQQVPITYNIHADLYILIEKRYKLFEKIENRNVFFF